MKRSPSAGDRSDAPHGRKLSTGVLNMISLLRALESPTDPEARFPLAKPERQRDEEDSDD